MVPSHHVPHDPASLPCLLAWGPLRLAIPDEKHPMLLSVASTSKTP
jgi:hypothetical protein